ncbi:MAG: ClpXP protease specificity-enhancing factor [Gammaproteobacteria bacterium]
MISQKPYLLRAIHQWIVDCGHTPYLVVDATASGVSVPAGYAKDGKLVLNLSYAATHGLDLSDNEQLEFDTRFGGVSRHLRLPVTAVLALYAQETGQGLVFQPDPPPEPATPEGRPAGSSAKPATAKKPRLKVVK